MTRFEVRVSDARPLAVGDELTFFYPSTEWEMVQPFRCQCNAGPGKCLGFIAGSSKIEPSVLEGFWLNEHIRQLLAMTLKTAEPSLYSVDAPVIDSPKA